MVSSPSPQSTVMESVGEAKSTVSLDETLAIHGKINAKRTVLTHISHRFDIWLSENTDTLPDSVVAGYDGLVAYP